MASSTLKLVIQKGPRGGETLEFNPRSTICIGRVARGNNLTIKDSGISSKHLKIHFDSKNFMKWVITDLDSCNGTFLNSSEIKPFSAFVISLGDEIKIGEITAIRVEIVENREEISVRGRTRRQGGVESGDVLREIVEIKDELEKCKNPRKRVICKMGDEDLKLTENVEIMDEIEKRKNPRKAGAFQKGTNENDEGSKFKGNVENKQRNHLEDCLNLEDLPGGRRKARPKKVSSFKELEIAKLKQDCSVTTRRTRSSKRGDDELMSGLEMLSLPGRKTRRAKNVEGMMEKITENKNVDANECKEEEDMNVVENNKPQRSHGLKKKEGDECSEKIQEIVLEEKTNLEVLEKEDGECLEKVHEVLLEENMHLKTFEEEGGERLKENMNLEVLETRGGECVEKDQEVVLEENIRLEVSEKEVLDKGLESREKTCGGTSQVQEMSNVVDLEYMTLGEWFDFLEVYLPNQIYGATNRIIEDMQKEAKVFNDFMLEQQKEKNKLPLATQQKTS